ncbi:MAG: tetratricopeptide repeat protein [Bacteroidia bacterium]
MKKILFILFIPLATLAQKADEELAAQFMADREFAKAADQYEKLLARNPKSMYFYDNLFKCYIQLLQFDDANKLAKRQQKKFESNYYYQVDAIYALQLKSFDDKVKQQYKNIISGVMPLEPKVHELANAFNKRGLKDYAIETYIFARKQLKRDLAFSLELAGLYADLNQKALAVDEFLNALILDENQQENIQGYLQNMLESAADYELLKQALLKKNKTYSGSDVFTEMLLWYYVQQNDYNNALIYSRALDRRYKEQGRKMLELGLLATSNEAYDAAVNIFSQVIALGKDAPYYNYAKNSLTEARAKKILAGNYTQNDLIELKNQYNALLTEFGFAPFMINTIKELAKLQAYYLYNYDSAIYLFEGIINMPRIDEKARAEAKLELGDLYVFKNEVWEAMLLYGQVDNDFKEEPIGREAKFRNARLSYFIGEFDWARSQLDVLKTATTQLISNNAIELSLLIQDNTIDSNEEPLKIYAKADLYYYQNNLNRAMQTLDSLLQLYPNHDLLDDIYYKKAQIFLKQKNYTKATEYFKIVYSEHGTGIFGDNALYELARLNQNILNNKDEALKLYEKFIDTYNGSFFLTEVRKQYRLLRGDTIN